MINRDDDVHFVATVGGAPDAYAREGICGDESPHHPINCSGTMRAICHLRFGHGSRWHESETGQRWKYHDADPIAAAESRGYAKAVAEIRDESLGYAPGRAAGYAEAIAKLRQLATTKRPLFTPSQLADLLEASTPTTEEPHA